MYSPVITLFISNELKESEIGFQISYYNFVGLLLLYVSTIKTLLITFYFSLRQTKPSQIYERVRKCNMMIMSDWKATGSYTFITTDAAFKNNKNPDLVTEMKPVKVEGL